MTAHTIDGVPMLDTAAIAARYCVTRKHAADVLVKKAWFPKPRINVSQKTRMWAEPDIEAAERKRSRK